MGIRRWGRHVVTHITEFARPSARNLHGFYTRWANSMSLTHQAHNRDHLAAMPDLDVVPDLPQELVDLIIGKLHTDKTALKNCSLVASAWTARSHYHLFYEVEILNETQLDAWTSLFPYPGASVVADLVRRLHIDQPTMLEDIPKFSLEQFRNLVHFSLGSMPFHQRTGSELGASAMDNIRLLPTSLRGLHLGLERTCAWHITTLFGHFQDLDDLSVRSHSFEPRRQALNAALVSSPRFRGELRVAIGIDLFVLTDLLQSLPNGVRFTRANLFLPLPLGAPCKVGVWLQSVAETLTSLHIDVTVQSECCGRWGYFPKGVRVLSLTCPQFSPGSPPESILLSTSHLSRSLPLYVFDSDQPIFSLR